MRYTQGDPGRAEALTKDLVQERVDVIVTNVTGTAMAARRATTVVPIVMYTSGYPVEGGLAKSLAQPGGNVTGMTIYAGGGVLFGKFVDLLRELVPSLRELGVLWGYAPPSYREEQVAPATDELRRAAKALNVNVRFWQTGTERDLGAALAAATSAPLDALFVTGGIIHGLPEIAARISRFALQRRLPTLTDFPGAFFAAAAILAYSVEVNELATRTAHFVDRILKGARPGELPIEQPTRYQLSVNLKTAKALGLTIPPSLMASGSRDRVAALDTRPVKPSRESPLLWCRATRARLSRRSQHFSTGHCFRSPGFQKIGTRSDFAINTGGTADDADA